MTLATPPNQQEEPAPRVRGRREVIASVLGVTGAVAVAGCASSPTTGEAAKTTTLGAAAKRSDADPAPSSSPAGRPEPAAIPGSTPSTTTPRAAHPTHSGAATAYSYFYGANAHYDYWWSAQQIVDHMHQISAKTVRFNTGGFDPSKYGKVAAFATAIAKLDPAIQIVAAIDAGFSSTDEQTEYHAAYQGAQTLAHSLGAAGIRVFECGNELTTDARVWPVSSLPGDVRDQYRGGSDWRCLRGWYRGLIDGVKSVNASYRTGVDFCVAQIAASDMLWNGVEPDGSGSHPTVRWDITMWHNYEVYGNPFAIGTTGHGKSFNLVDYIARAYRRPIMITEWNADHEDSDAAKAAFTTNYLTQMWQNRVRYGIESIMLYQMDGGPADFGLFTSPQQTAAYAKFAASHPG